jgi:hypothetical protein
MPNLRRTALLLLVVALTLALGVSLAGAKKKKKHTFGKTTSWDSGITLSLTTPTHFDGAVTSPLDLCRNQRYVIIYYKDPFTDTVAPLSVQRTDAAGRYQVDLVKPAFAGEYSAQVSEERVQVNDAPQICNFASSGSVTVSG